MSADEPTFDDRILRAIGDPSARFAEDRLRLLRAVRFAARFGLAIEPATREAIAAMAGRVTGVSAERIAQELRRILVHPSRSRAMAMAAEFGLLAAALPGVSITARTLRVLDALPEAPAFPLAFAALLHELAPAAVLDLSGRLKLSNLERDRAAWLVENQRALIDPANLPRHTLKRLLASEGIADLLALHRALAAADGAAPSHVAYVEAYLRDQPEGPIDPPPLADGPRPRPPRPPPRPPVRDRPRSPPRRPARRARRQPRGGPRLRGRPPRRGQQFGLTDRARRRRLRGFRG